MKKLSIHRVAKVAVVALVMIASSCTDWLSIAPENDLIKEKFWTKTEDVESALASTYDALRSTSLQSLIFGELRADLITFTGDEFSDYAKIAGSDISPTNGAVNWSNYYKAINLANTLMHFDDEVAALDQTFTQELKDAYEAEARFIRSMSYFYLVRLWKDVPLVEEASISDTSDIFLPKSTEYEVIDFIIEDLLVAKDMAYTTEFMGSNIFTGRANKYSIMALLADVYLWDEQYQMSVNYCDSIIESGHYSLEPTETSFDIYYPGNSRESIFEIQYDDNLDDQDNPLYNSLIPISGGAKAMLDAQNINLIMEREDTRRYYGRGSTWKYKGKDGLGLISRSYTEKDANWILYRFADILMIKAEALVELGSQTGTANELIAETLLRASMPYVPQTDKELLRQEVLDERGREFLLEGKRWFDLLRAAKRNDFEKKQIIIEMILSGADIKQQAVLRTRVFDTLSYYLPIPEYELLFNQNLEQNPFYDR